MFPLLSRKERGHAIRVSIDEALKCKETGDLSGEPLAEQFRLHKTK